MKEMKKKEEEEEGNNPCLHSEANKTNKYKVHELLTVKAGGTYSYH
jgi:hypothetical protein